MAATHPFESEILRLDAAIEQAPGVHTLYLERGKIYQQAGQFDKALNDFVRVTQLDSENQEAQTYIKMIHEIFDFRHNDLYNP